MAARYVSVAPCRLALSLFIIHTTNLEIVESAGTTKESNHHLAAMALQFLSSFLCTRARPATQLSQNR